MPKLSAAEDFALFVTQKKYGAILADPPLYLGEEQ